EKADVGFPEIAADHVSADAISVAARFRQLKRLARPAMHLRHQLRRREWSDIAFEHDVADSRARSLGDMEDDGRAALLANERRLRIDRRFEISRAIQKILNGDRAAIDGAEVKDV